MNDEPRVQSAQNATHWIAWMAGPGDGRPIGDWTMVGQTKEEAEGRAREWWASWHSAGTRRYPSPSSSSASSNKSPSEST
jgi:hypothetical protein